MFELKKNNSAAQPRLWLDLAGIFLLGLIVRIALIQLHPAVYGGDALVRLMNADRVLIAYQLPLLQLLIYLTNLVSKDPLIVRYLMSILGATAGAVFYLFSTTWLERPVARLASLFFIFSPFLLVHSIVPYQEILMVLTLCSGLYFLLRPDLRRSIWWTSFSLGLACLTRYESWVITLVAGVYYAGRRLASRSAFNYLSVLFRTTAWFGWAPLLWILLNRGLNPQGTYVLEGLSDWARLWRIPYIVMMAVYHAGPITTLFASLGLFAFWRESLWKRPGLCMILTATSLLLLTLVFSAHGVEPHKQRYVTDREAHWLLLFPFWAAALGLSQIKHWLIPRAGLLDTRPEAAFRKARAGAYYLILLLPMVWGWFQTDRYIKRLIADQNLKIDYQVAQHLERNLSDGARALVFAQPGPQTATQQYFDKVYSKGGMPALDVARRQLAELNSGPLDYSRIVVNTWLGKEQILDGDKLSNDAAVDPETFLSLNRVRLAVVFSDSAAHELTNNPLLDYVKLRGKKKATFVDPGLEVSIYEIPL